MNQPGKKVRVTGSSPQRAPGGIRKLGKALIALAQAQLEAEAEAEAAAKAAHGKEQQPDMDNDRRIIGDHQ